MLVGGLGTQASVAEQLVAGLQFEHRLAQRVGALADLLGQHHGILEGTVGLVALRSARLDASDQRLVDPLQLVPLFFEGDDPRLQLSDGHLRGSANGDPGEGLVDMHAIELLSVGVEADHLLAAEKRGGSLRVTADLQLQAPQEAVATDGQQRRSEALVEAAELRLQVGQQRAGAHRGENDAVLHRTVERQAQVLVGLLDRAHVIAFVDPHRQRMRGEQGEIQRLRRHPDQPGVFQRSRLGVEFVDPPAAAVGAGHHQLLGARHHVMGGEDLEVQPGVDQHHHCRPGMELALVVDMGVGQVPVVAGRATEMRDRAERRAKRGEHHLFAAGQAVEQGQGETVVLDRRQAAAATAGHQGLDHLLRVQQAEALHFVDQRAADGEAAHVEAHRADAAAPVARRSDLAGCGAADQVDAAEVAFEHLGKGRQVVFRGTEEQHEAQVRMDKLARQVLGHHFDVARAGHAPADPFPCPSYMPAPRRSASPAFYEGRRRGPYPTWVAAGSFESSGITSSVRRRGPRCRCPRRARHRRARRSGSGSARRPA